MQKPCCLSLNPGFPGRLVAAFPLATPGGQGHRQSRWLGTTFSSPADTTPVPSTFNSFSSFSLNTSTAPTSVQCTALNHYVFIYPNLFSPCLAKTSPAPATHQIIVTAVEIGEKYHIQALWLTSSTRTA